MGFERTFDGVGGEGVEGWSEVGCGVERILVSVAGVGVGYFLQEYTLGELFGCGLNVVKKDLP